MRIVHGYPPNYAELVKAFDIGGRTDVIFSWGSTVYVLNGNGVLTPSLRAHEQVHGDRQTDDTAKIEAWWKSYLADPEFRLAEEIRAHREEFRTYCKNTPDRNRRARQAHTIAQRFASPIYGGIISFKKAKEAISK